MKIGKKVLAYILTLVLLAGIVPGFTFTVHAEHYYNEIDISLLGDKDETYTTWSYDASTNTITVKDFVRVYGSKTNATKALNININQTLEYAPSVCWYAEYSGSTGKDVSLINLTGNEYDFILEGSIKNFGNGDGINAVSSGSVISVAANAAISVQSGTAIISNGDVNVSYGTIKSESGTAIYNGSADSLVTIGSKFHSWQNYTDRGIVQVGGDKPAIETVGNVVVDGGIINAATGLAITASGDLDITG